MHRLAIVLAVLMSCTLSFAGNHKNKQNHTCQGGHNCNTNNGSTTTTNTDTVTVKDSSKSEANSKSSASSAASSTSNIKDSGNSSNQNTLGQQQSQASTSAATNNGSGSNNATTTVLAPKIPVSTAYAPTAIPTVPCFKGYGAGVQTMPVGVSLGGGKIDANCAILETARSFAISGSRLAYCKTMITSKFARKAGVSLDDCMKTVEVPEPQAVVVTVPPAPQVVVPVSGLVSVPAPVIVVSAPAPLPVVVPPVVPAKQITDVPAHKVVKHRTAVKKVCNP